MTTFAITHTQYCTVFHTQLTVSITVRIDFSVVQPAGFFILLHHSVAFKTVDCTFLLGISAFFRFWGLVPSGFPLASWLCFFTFASSSSCVTTTSTTTKIQNSSVHSKKFPCAPLWSNPSTWKPLVCFLSLQFYLFNNVI